MIAILIILLLLALLYVLSTVCRKNHDGVRLLEGHAYAHRGLHGEGSPENSMEAFGKAVDAGYGIELDVHLLSDGDLAIIHDSLLQRTTGAQGCIEDLTRSDLTNYKLNGTEQTIPLFSDVLSLVDGRVPLIIELKVKDGNYAQLCKTVCGALDGYQGVFCLESFDPRCVFWLRRHRPDLIRGQLVMNYLTSGNGKLPWFAKFMVTHQMFNFLTYPDFIAYRYTDRKTFSNVLCRKLWGAKGVTWTLPNQKEYDAAENEGWIPIFEGFKP